MALSQVLQALLDMNPAKPGMEKPKPKPKAESFNMSGASSKGVFQKPKLDNPGEASDLGAPLGFWEAYGNNVRPDIREQAQAKLDTTRSEVMRTQASQMMNDANALPHAQVTGKPNLESILLALAPAALGVNPSYLGKLGAGYMQGQQQELARQEQQRQQKVAMMMQQAQGMEKGADRALQGELATYSQDSQNERNNADNARIAKEADLTRKHQDDLKKYGQQEADFRFIQSVADKHFNESAFGQTEELQKELMDALKVHSEKYGVPLTTLTERFQGRNVGDKGIAAIKLSDLQNDKAYKKGVDIWKSYLTTADRQQTITADDIRDLTNERQWIHDNHKVPLEAMPLPKEGQGWKQYVQDQNLGFRKNSDTRADNEAKRKAFNDAQKVEDDQWKEDAKSWSEKNKGYEEATKALKAKVDAADKAWHDAEANYNKETDRKKKVALKGVVEQRFNEAKAPHKEYNKAVEDHKQWQNDNPMPTRNILKQSDYGLEPSSPVTEDGGGDTDAPPIMPPWMKPSEIGGGSAPKGKPGKTLPRASVSPKATRLTPKAPGALKLKNGRGFSR